MRKTRTLRALGLTTMAFAMTIAAPQVRAQQTQPQTTAQGTQPQAARDVAAPHEEKIALRYVPPSLMAWWLNPTGNAQPAFMEWAEREQRIGMPQQAAPPVQARPQQGNKAVENKTLDLPEGVDSVISQDRLTKEGFFVHGTPESLAKIRAAMKASRAQGSSAANGAFALPEGIEKIVPLDTQNAILVVGTPTGVERLRTVVKLLDQPIPQVQIEVRVVEMPKDVFITPAADTETSSVMTVRFQKEAELAALVESKRARVVHDSRVSTPNNTAAILNFESSSSALVQTQKDGATTRQPSVLTDSLRFVLTPTVNRDGTITVSMNTRRQLKSEGETPLTGFPDAVLSQSAINTIVNASIGGTVAIAGPRPKPSNKTPFTVLPFGYARDAKAPIPDEQAGTRILVLVTPSIATNDATPEVK